MENPMRMTWGYPYFRKQRRQPAAHVFWAQDSWGWRTPGYFWDDGYSQTEKEVNAHLDLMEGLSVYLMCSIYMYIIIYIYVFDMYMYVYQVTTAKSCSWMQIHPYSPSHPHGKRSPKTMETIWKPWFLAGSKAISKDYSVPSWHSAPFCPSFSCFAIRWKAVTTCQLTEDPEFPNVSAKSKCEWSI